MSFENQEKKTKEQSIQDSLDAIRKLWDSNSENKVDTKSDKEFGRVIIDLDSTFDESTVSS